MPGRIAFPIPRGILIASVRTGLPTWPHPARAPSHSPGGTVAAPRPGGTCSLRPLHGYWDSPGLTPASHGTHCAPRIAAHPHRLFICREHYTRRGKRVSMRKNGASGRGKARALPGGIAVDDLVVDPALLMGLEIGRREIRVDGPGIVVSRHHAAKLANDSHSRICRAAENL